MNAFAAARAQSFHRDAVPSILIIGQTLPRANSHQGQIAMCRNYAGTAPSDYEPVRSLRLHGTVFTGSTSNDAHWAIIDEMAQGRGAGFPQFIATLYDEVLDEQGEVRNFTSLLRVVCAIYLGGLEFEPKAARVR